MCVVYTECMIVYLCTRKTVICWNHRYCVGLFVSHIKLVSNLRTVLIKWETSCKVTKEDMLHWWFQKSIENKGISQGNNGFMMPNKFRQQPWLVMLLLLLNCHYPQRTVSILLPLLLPWPFLHLSNSWCNQPILFSFVLAWPSLLPPLLLSSEQGCLIDVFSVHT